MSRIVIVLVLLASAVTPPASSRSALSQRAPDLRASLDSMVSARVAEDSFSGVVLLERNGTPVYQRASGIANRSTRSPVSLDTKFQIASMTKLFTRIAIWQLEQQGRLSLSDTLGKFLPGYHNAVARREVTVAQLLEHRSGIGSFWNKRFMERHEQVRTVNDYVDLFQDDSLLFAPGSSMIYSNGGYVLLGAIIEKVSGQSYHDYLRDHVFTPAGMSNTMPYERGVVRENAAVGYTFQSPGPVTGDARLAGSAARPGSEERTNSERQMMIRGAGADSSTNASPPDGAHLRLIGPDGKELSPEQTRAAMAQAHHPGQSRQPNTGFQPGMSGPAGDDYSTARDLVSLATALTKHVLLDSTRTAAVLGSRYAAGGEFRANGGGPGVNSELSIYPSGEVLVVLSNYDPPSATTIAQFIRARMPTSAASPRQR